MNNPFFGQQLLLGILDIWGKVAVEKIVVGEVLDEFVRKFWLIQVYTVAIFMNQKLFCKFCKSFWFLFVKFEIK